MLQALNYAQRNKMRTVQNPVFGPGLNGQFSSQRKVEELVDTVPRYGIKATVLLLALLLGCKTTK